jgi:hypothetical protein
MNPWSQAPGNPEYQKVAATSKRMKQEISREGNQDVLNFSTRLKALRKQS